MLIQLSEFVCSFIGWKCVFLVGGRPHRLSSTRKYKFHRTAQRCRRQPRSHRIYLTKSRWWLWKKNGTHTNSGGRVYEALRARCVYGEDTMRHTLVVRNFFILDISTGRNMFLLGSPRRSTQGKWVQIHAKGWKMANTIIIVRTPVRVREFSSLCVICRHFKR